MKQPTPEEWDLTVAELAYVLRDVKHGKARESLLMNKYFVTNQVAGYWLKLVREHEQERVAS